MVALRFDDEAKDRRRAAVPGPRRSSPARSERSASRRRGVAASGVGPWPVLAAVVGLLLGGSLMAGDDAGRQAAPFLTGVEQIARRPGGGVSPGGGTVHVVQPGESYWSIATALHGGSGGDVRSLVDVLMAANDSRALRSGDRVVVPGAGR